MSAEVLSLPPGRVAPGPMSDPVPAGLPSGPAGTGSGPAMPALSLGDILRTVFRHRLAIGVIVGCAVLGALGYVLAAGETYTASTKILVRVGREKLTPLAVGNVQGSNLMFNERVENTNDEIEIIRNPSLTARAFPILKARLESDAARAGADPEPTTLAGRVRAALRSARGAASRLGAGVKDALRAPLEALGLSRRITPDQALAEQFNASLGAVFVKSTNVIILGFSWSDPAFAAFAVNTYAEEYRREHLRILNNVTGSAEFFEAQAARAEAEMRDVDRSLSDLQASSRLTDPATEKQLTVDLIGTLQRRAGEVEVASRGTRARLDDLRALPRDAWPETPAVAQASLSSLVELDGRRSGLLSQRNRLVDSPPSARAIIDGQIARLRTTKLEGVRAYYVERLRADEGEARSLAGQIATARTRLDGLTDLAARWTTLRSQRDALQNQVTEYGKRIEGLRVEQALNKADVASVTILSPAEPPVRPEWPRKGLVLALAALLGCVLCVPWIVLAEMFSVTFPDAARTSRALGLPVVAAVPEVRA